MKSRDHPLQCFYNIYECEYDTIVSICPCRKNVGHITFLILSRLWNLSQIKKEDKLPRLLSFTTLLIDAIGEISIKEDIFLL